jgi:hypothetical protein
MDNWAANDTAEPAELDGHADITLLVLPSGSG